MKKKTRKFFICLCYLWIAFTVIQCSQTKKLGLEGNIQKKTLVDELEDMNTLVINSYKLQIAEENGVSGKFKGYIKAIRGKGLMVSVRSGMNIEIARVWVKKDTITILNRVEREINKIDIRRYLGDCMVLLNDDWPIFLLIGKNPVKKEYMEETGKKNWNISYGECKIKIEEENEKKINKRMNISIMQNDIYLTYRNGNKKNGSLITEKIEMNVISDKKKIKCILEMENEIINKEIDISIQVPDSYRQSITMGL